MADPSFAYHSHNLHTTNNLLLAFAIHKLKTDFTILTFCVSVVDFTTLIIIIIIIIIIVIIIIIIIIVMIIII